MLMANKRVSRLIWNQKKIKNNFLKWFSDKNLCYHRQNDDF